MKKHMLPGNNALLKCFVVLMTILSAYSSNAQCNVGAESNPSPISPSGCSNGRVLLGSGANYSLAILPNTYYNFSYTTGPNSNGFCATPQNGSASSFTSSQIGWFSGTTTTLLVSSSRVPGTPATSWSG
ncbi:MAG TPA: hypothetical protein PLW44_05090, partial [Chitinophagales bacterium]|nr:hypothetical protein [Chitinophagales bacterium]